MPKKDRPLNAKQMLKDLEKSETTATATATAGDRHRERESQRRRKSSSSVREAGPLRPVADPARRERGRRSLRAFCLEYFPARFKMPFAALHHPAIERMERCTDEGGLFACAMPRATGKTSLGEVAVIRAVLYGLRRFVVLIAATGQLAKRRLKQILKEFAQNDQLNADFPEVCQLIRALDRLHQRAAGQLLDGKPTGIEITAEGIILPTVPGKPSSGSIIQVASMEGAIRGMNVLSPTGEPLRPDMVVLDDVQTRDSAKSPLQTADREATITGDVLNLAGPDVQIAAVMLCTVIFPADLSDRFLSKDRHPEWQSVRTKMLESFPANMTLWDEYAEVRRESFRSDDRGRRANDFYIEHREELDRGARVSWPERMKPGEISGIQSAMNWFYHDRLAFMAEAQNEPEPEGGFSRAKELNPELVAGRLSGLPRMTCPHEASRVTAGIDVGGKLLWYLVAAWDEHFGGTILDYGSWPRQNRSIYAAADPRPALSDIYSGSESEIVYRGLADLTADILGRVYFRERSGELRVERALIDCGWLTPTIYQFVRASPHTGILYPSKGIGRTTTARGISEWKPRPGERSGYNWRLTVSETGRGQMVQFDPDAWKSFLFERLTTAPGGRGYLSLFGRDPGTHELLTSHLAAEAAEPVTIRGQTFDKWSIRPHQPDNHLLDAAVLSAVAASVQGTTWSASGTPTPKPKRKSMAEERNEARRRQGLPVDERRHEKGVGPWPNRPNK